MVTMMSKTNETSKLLTDSELDAVSGGTTVGALGYTSHIPLGLPVPPGGPSSLLGAAMSGAISGASGAV